MKTRLVPAWLRVPSLLMLAVPMVGFVSQAIGSTYFKQYVADVLISVISSFGTALIHIAVEQFLYGGA